MTKLHFLTNNIKGELEKLRHHHHLRFIILHGSYAKGKERKDSDCDIAVVGNKPVGFKEIIDLHSSLTDLFEAVGIYDVDVKSLDRVDPLFRYLVVRDSVLLAGKPFDYNEFKAYAFRDYLDSVNLRILERRMIKVKQKILSERYA